MEIKDRVKQIREHFHLSQRAFAERINIAAPTLAHFESGNRKIKDIHIKQICNEFNVDENWLRTGKGLMFKVVDSDSSVIEQIVKEYDFDDMDKQIIQAYMKLNKEQRKIIKENIMNIAKIVKEMNLEEKE